jgi:hypothetical protein
VVAAYEAPEPAQRTFCLTLAHSGARLSEVAAWTDRQIDLVAGRIVFESLKKRCSGMYRAVRDRLRRRLSEPRRLGCAYVPVAVMVADELDATVCFAGFPRIQKPGTL